MPAATAAAAINREPQERFILPAPSGVEGPEKLLITPVRVDLGMAKSLPENEPRAVRTTRVIHRADDRSNTTGCQASLNGELQQTGQVLIGPFGYDFACRVFSAVV